jgi:hypothetical protein
MASIFLAEFCQYISGIPENNRIEERAIARGLHYPAAMFLDLGIGQLAPECLQPGEGSVFVRAHETRVAGHIGGENGGQPAFDAFRGQSGAPLPHGLNRLSASGAHSNGKREGWHSLSARPPAAFCPLCTAPTLRHIGRNPRNSAGAMERSNKNASPLWQSNPAKPVRENGPNLGGLVGRRFAHVHSNSQSGANVQ